MKMPFNAEKKNIEKDSLEFQLFLISFFRDYFKKKYIEHSPSFGEKFGLFCCSRLSEEQYFGRYPCNEFVDWMIRLCQSQLEKKTFAPKVSLSAMAICMAYVQDMAINEAALRLRDAIVDLVEFADIHFNQDTDFSALGRYCAENNIRIPLVLDLRLATGSPRNMPTMLINLMRKQPTAVAQAESTEPASSLSAVA